MLSIDSSKEPALEAFLSQDCKVAGSFSLEIKAVSSAGTGAKEAVNFFVSLN